MCVLVILSALRPRFFFLGPSSLSFLTGCWAAELALRSSVEKIEVGEMLMRE